jgi:hypothetical protein
LKQAVELYDFYNRQIAACDREIEAKYAAFKPRVDIEEKPLKPPKRKRNQPEGKATDFDLRSYLYLMAGVDLTQIDGLDVLTVQTILSALVHFEWIGIIRLQIPQNIERCVRQLPLPQNGHCTKIGLNFVNCLLPH